MNRYLAIACLLVVSVCGGPIHAQEAVDETGREVLEVEIDAGIADVWWAFTTTEGIRAWVTPIADIDFKVGGKWRSNYNQDGQLGDANTIENTILAFDPNRMIALKATGFPEGFPFKEAAKDAWSVFYFQPVSENRTRIRVVGLGYTDSEESQKMRSFFKGANKSSLDQLEAALKKRAAEKQK